MTGNARAGSRIRCVPTGRSSPRGVIPPVGVVAGAEHDACTGLLPVALLFTLSSDEGPSAGHGVVSLASMRTASPACAAAHQRASSRTRGMSKSPIAAEMPASYGVSTVRKPRLVTPYSWCGCEAAQPAGEADDRRDRQPGHVLPGLWVRAERPQVGDEASISGSAVDRHYVFVALPSREPAVDPCSPAQHVHEADPDEDTDDE